MVEQRKFELVSHYKPTGDQPQAIAQLVDGLNDGKREQTLLGVTGSGKTFTVANVIAQVNKPTLILAHNKTLAAQLCSEFREFFPNNAVEYFVSYYDYSSRRPILPRPIPISKRIPPSTTRLSGCATQPPHRWANAAMLSS